MLHKSLHTDTITTQIKQDKSISNDINLAIYNASIALKEFGISQLTCEDAELILSLRVDL